MNTFIFASILALANANAVSAEGSGAKGASPAGGAEPSKPPTSEASPIDIKDNLLYVLDLGQFHCDGKAFGNITISNEPAQQVYLYPIVQDNQDIVISSLSEGKYTKISRYTKDQAGKYPEFPGHFAVANQKIKNVEYSTSGHDLKYSVYVIPPEVSSGNVVGKPHELKFNVDSVFTCNSNALPAITKSYPFIVTNNARTASLVSSTLVLAFAAIFLL
ncbi:hypothetical protein DSO57_1029589 [Entomophthora muscae]|uniref:Uncharacterized protein n=1 Tax=Entomophthora muscae TaxID=34485 RepID=A0ACC2RS78_9FUNG|nr:hypothetical protein DSO57_1029589 [Entomophthora muscae]